MSMQRLQETLTIRLSRPASRRLRQRARRAGKTPSEIIRLLIERELDTADSDTGPTLHDLSRKWIGKAASRAIPAGRDARVALEDWIPDRRG